MDSKEILEAYERQLREALNKQRDGAGDEYAAAALAQQHLASELSRSGVQPVSIGLSTWQDGEFYIVVEVLSARDLRKVPQDFEGVKVEGTVGQVVRSF